MNSAFDVASARRERLNIAVFRALNLGDLLCSVPAFRALRRSCPNASISLIGLPSAQPIMARFGDYIDELILFPGDAEFPEQPVAAEALPAFYSEMHARQFDLALQMHGSGLRANDIVGRFHARTNAGFVPNEKEAKPGYWMAWPDTSPEVDRYLMLLAYLGLATGLDDQTSALELPLDAPDYDEADALLASYALKPERLIVLHAGARLLSRRWPLMHFARLACALIDDGWQLALTGSRDELPLTHALADFTGGRAVNLCAKTSLGGMAALLTRARLLICNDTGVSHIAAAVAAPSMVIACGSDVRRWAPKNHELHEVLWADMACRPCAKMTCPYAGHPCARAITVDAVLQRTRERLIKEPLLI